MFGLTGRGRAPAAALAGAMAALSIVLGAPADAAAYQPIAVDAAARPVLLTGRDLTIEQVVDVARRGAKVELSPEARQRAADTYGLLLQSAANGVPVYLFTRGGGNNRENTSFTGDPMTPENKARLETNLLRAFRNGARAGVGPEVEFEASTRAMMLVRANTITWDGPSPQLMQMLIDLLNHRITPVLQSPNGTVGEADISLMNNIAATMVGAGEAYFEGQRMPATEALRRAGLAPIQPFGADNTALTSTNAWTASQAALLVADARHALEWMDLAYAFDLLGMNSSITPLAAPTQRNRPDPWLNWHAGRMLEVVRGSYLFEADPKRIIQDPDSLRASSIRQGALWKAWADMAEAARFQINSSDHNPTIRVGLEPGDSWELSTPMMMQFYIRGGALSGGKSGYITSTANWDPYPLANEVEAFTIALANADVAMFQRMYRFANPFHTGVAANEVLSAEVTGQAPGQGNGTTAASIWSNIVDEIDPVTPQGIATDVQGTTDITSQTPLKIAKARRAVRSTMRLMAQDVMTGTYWIEVRRAQDPSRAFGAAPAAALEAYRRVSPWRSAPADRPEAPAADAVLQFLQATPAAAFLPPITLPVR